MLANTAKIPLLTPAIRASCCVKELTFQVYQHAQTRVRSWHVCERGVCKPATLIYIEGVQAVESPQPLQVSQIRKRSINRAEPSVRNTGTADR